MKLLTTFIILALTLSAQAEEKRVNFESLLNSKSKSKRDVSIALRYQNLSNKVTHGEKLSDPNEASFSKTTETEYF